MLRLRYAGTTVMGKLRLLYSMLNEYTYRDKEISDHIPYLELQLLEPTVTDIVLSNSLKIVFFTFSLQGLPSIILLRHDLIRF